MAYDEEPPLPPTYPLTPNLIMEGGRIQFKPPPPPPPEHEYDAPPPDVSPSPTEKCDPVKVSALLVVVLTPAPRPQHSPVWISSTRSYTSFPQIAALVTL